MNFPLDILRLELEAFAAARTVVVNGACADPVRTLSALVAGASYATDCLFLVLVGPCDQMLIEHPQQPLCEVNLFMYADDLVTLISGPGGAANTEATAVADNVVAKFETALEMQISRGRKPWKLCTSSKSIALASSKIARARFEPTM